MSKILIAGAGGTPSENVIECLLAGGHEEEIIGMNCDPSDLMLSAASRKYIVPCATEKGYEKSLIKLLNKEKPELIHFQNDIEILEASKLRHSITDTGTKVFMPSHTVIENCVDKGKSATIWEKSGIKIPKTLTVKDARDLRKAFETLGNNDGKIWLRANVGGGGRGALPTGDYDFAEKWISKFNGWGEFTAAELLTEDSVTWLSIWYEGGLVVAQTRKRRSWNLGNRTLSGVTGVTKVGETFSSEDVNTVAQDSILSIDKKPHGIYGVDMTYDNEGAPNPTEINISRFFTTSLFFTRAGLNMPKIFKDIALYDSFPTLDKKINPLKDGLLWLRNMDTPPMLTTEEEMRQEMLEL
jgi:hypothetical protein